MFNRIIHAFRLVFWYFLVLKHNASCQDPLHTHLLHGWVAHARSQFCCGAVALNQEGHLSWAFAFCLLSYAAACPVPSHILCWTWTTGLPSWPSLRAALSLWVDFGDHGLWLTLVSLTRPALLFLFEYLCLRPWSVRALPLPLLWSPSAPDSPPLAGVAALKCFLTRVPLLIQEQGSVFPFPDHSMKNQYRKYRHTQMLNFEGGYACTAFLSL